VVREQPHLLPFGHHALGTLASRAAVSRQDAITSSALRTSSTCRPAFWVMPPMARTISELPADNSSLIAERSPAESPIPFDSRMTLSITPRSLAPIWPIARASVASSAGISPAPLDAGRLRRSVAPRR
jgi:hypothetical protein